MNWNYLTNVNQRVTWCLVQSHYTDSPFLMHCHLARAVQFSSVQSLSRVRLSATPWTSARQASLSITHSRSLLKLMSIELVMPANHLILCHLLLLRCSIFPSIRVFSDESAPLIKWPKYWSFSISPSNEYSGLISFRTDWFDLLAVEGFSMDTQKDSIKTLAHLT